MYGDQGLKLVQDAKRIQALPVLPPYQTELVRTIVAEVRELDEHVASILAPYSGVFAPSQDPALACVVLVDHMAMRRNKRCLLSYHKTRADRLESMCWTGKNCKDDVQISTAGERDFGEIDTAKNGTSAAAQNSLSPEEVQYMHEYEELLAGLKGQWTDIDLTGSLEPPSDLFIDVRVLKDAGEIQTEYGEITLTKNSQFYVRQGDVERLIAQGYLQKLS